MSGKVLVTGASGYLAGHVVQQLQSAGYEVRGTVRSTQNETKVKHLYNLCPDAKHRLQLVEADLTKPETWDGAVEGMDYVIHTASPFPLQPPKKEEEVIKPAVEGTLAVLKACAKASTVKRVVLTSSCAAIDFGGGKESSGVMKSERDWTDAASKSTEGYVRSKTLAEKAAWDFVNNLSGAENKFELAVINPSFIMGPPLQGSTCTSIEVVKMLLERQVPRVPRIQLNMHDVRDCAAAHIKAMTVPEAAGNRHIVSSQPLWFGELAKLLHVVFEPQGYSVPTKAMPGFLLWIAGIFDSSANQMYKQLGIEHRYDTRRMREILGIEPHNYRDTVIEMAYALIEAGFVKKTAQYRGPGGPEERQKYLNADLSS